MYRKFLIPRPIRPVEQAAFENGKSTFSAAQIRLKECIFSLMMTCFMALKEVILKNFSHFSATMDSDDFAYYFREKGPVVDIDAPVISVDGRNYPVEVLYDEDIIRDLERYHNRSKDRISKVLAQAAAWKVRGIVRGGTTGDILVFLPGQVASSATCDLLKIQ